MIKLIEINPLVSELGGGSLGKTSKVQATKEKIDQLDISCA